MIFQVAPIEMDIKNCTIGICSKGLDYSHVLFFVNTFRENPVNSSPSFSEFEGSNFKVSKLHVYPCRKLIICVLGLFGLRLQKM